MRRQVPNCAKKLGLWMKTTLTPMMPMFSKLLWSSILALVCVWGTTSSQQAERSNDIALCGDQSIVDDVITLTFAVADVITSSDGCSCDVTAADGGLASMAVSVRINYTSSCPGLQLKFNQSASQPVQCQSGQGILNASYSLPAIKLTSFGVRLDLTATPRPISMSVSVGGSAALRGVCGHPATVSTSRPTPLERVTSTPRVTTTSDLHNHTGEPLTQLPGTAVLGGISQGGSNRSCCPGNSSCCQGNESCCHGTHAAGLAGSRTQDRGSEKTARMILAVVMTTGVVIVAVVVTFVYLKRTDKLYLCPWRAKPAPSAKPYRVTTLHDVIYAGHKNDIPLDKVGNDVKTNFILKSDSDSGIFIHSPGASMTGTQGVSPEREAGRQTNNAKPTDRGLKTAGSKPLTQSNLASREDSSTTTARNASTANIKGASSHGNSKKVKIRESPESPPNHYHSVDIVDSQQSQQGHSASHLSPRQLGVKLEYDKLRRNPDHADSHADRYNHIPTITTTDRDNDFDKQQGTGFAVDNNRISPNTRTNRVSFNLQEHDKKSRTKSIRSLLGTSQKPKMSNSKASSHNVDNYNDSTHGGSHVVPDDVSQEFSEMLDTITVMESSFLDLPLPPPPPEVVEDCGGENDWQERVLQSQILVFKGHYSVPRSDADHVPPDVTDCQDASPSSSVTSV